jgi:3-hydroxyacyl-CoA dehydrogenase
MGMHWFNPPEWTPGIELIPAQVTDPQAVEQVRSFLQAIGKHPIVVGSGPGFVANRIQLALFREALACVEDGLASPAEVDEVVRNCFGFRLPFFGPFQIADMAGLDVYGMSSGSSSAAWASASRCRRRSPNAWTRATTGPKLAPASSATRPRSASGCLLTATGVTPR